MLEWDVRPRGRARLSARSSYVRFDDRIELIAGQGYNHFEMIETLANPYGLLGRAALDLMKLL